MSFREVLKSGMMKMETEMKMEMVCNASCKMEFMNLKLQVPPN